MKIKFLAVDTEHNYSIANDTINELDLSVFPEGGQFVGDETTRSAGIYSVSRENGELCVTLGQKGVAYEAPTASHEWAESEWIDAASHDPKTCYIVATAKPDGAEYVKRAEGWTVAMPQEVDNELV